MSSFSARRFVQKANDSADVVIFSKTYCPYCKATKELFSSPAFQHTKVISYELDEMKNGAAIQRELLTMTGQRTVPSVFVQGRHLGGNDDTQQAYRNGSLAAMLAQAD